MEIKPGYYETVPIEEGDDIAFDEEQATSFAEGTIKAIPSSMRVRPRRYKRIVKRASGVYSTTPKRRRILKKKSDDDDGEPLTLLDVITLTNIKLIYGNDEEIQVEPPVTEKGQKRKLSRINEESLQNNSLITYKRKKLQSLPSTSTSNFDGNVSAQTKKLELISWNASLKEESISKQALTTTIENDFDGPTLSYYHTPPSVSSPMYQGDNCCQPGPSELNPANIQKQSLPISPVSESTTDENMFDFSNKIDQAYPKNLKPPSEDESVESLLEKPYQPSALTGSEPIFSSSPANDAYLRLPMGSDLNSEKLSGNTPIQIDPDIWLSYPPDCEFSRNVDSCTKSVLNQTSVVVSPESYHSSFRCMSGQNSSDIFNLPSSSISGITSSVPVPLKLVHTENGAEQLQNALTPLKASSSKNDSMATPLYEKIKDSKSDSDEQVVLNSVLDQLEEISDEGEVFEDNDESICSKKNDVSVCNNESNDELVDVQIPNSSRRCDHASEIKFSNREPLEDGEIADEDDEANFYGSTQTLSPNMYRSNKHFQAEPPDTVKYYNRGDINFNSSSSLLVDFDDGSRISQDVQTESKLIGTYETSKDVHSTGRAQSHGSHICLRPSTLGQSSSFSTFLTSQDGAMQWMERWNAPRNLNFTATHVPAFSSTPSMQYGLFSHAPIAQFPQREPKSMDICATPAFEIVKTPSGTFVPFELSPASSESFEDDDEPSSTFVAVSEGSVLHKNNSTKSVTLLEICANECEKITQLLSTFEGRSSSPTYESESTPTLVDEPSDCTPIVSPVPIVSPAPFPSQRSIMPSTPTSMPTDIGRVNQVCLNRINEFSSVIPPPQPSSKSLPPPEFELSVPSQFAPSTNHIISSASVVQPPIGTKYAIPEVLNPRERNLTPSNKEIPIFTGANVINLECGAQSGVQWNRSTQQYANQSVHLSSNLRHSQPVFPSIERPPPPPPHFGSVSNDINSHQSRMANIRHVRMVNAGQQRIFNAAQASIANSGQPMMANVRQPMFIVRQRTLLRPVFVLVNPTRAVSTPQGCAQSILPGQLPPPFFPIGQYMARPVIQASYPVPVYPQPSTIGVLNSIENIEVPIGTQPVHNSQYLCIPCGHQIYFQPPQYTDRSVNHFPLPSHHSIPIQVQRNPPPTPLRQEYTNRSDDENDSPPPLVIDEDRVSSPEM